MQVDDALVDNLADLRFLMRRKLAVQPRLIVSLRIDEAIPMETVLAVQQELREAGTLRINYSTKKHNPAL
jgi:biopolymer transport protein ExbD